MKKNDWILIASLLLLILSLWLFNNSDIDVNLQNYLYNFSDHSWLIDKDEPIKKFIFYKFPKILFGVCITVFLVLTILAFKRKNDFLYSKRNQIFLIFLGLSLIPLIAGNIKKFTNIYCPNQLEIYNGKYPYVKIFEKYPSDFKQIKKGQCFPGGHAVTGFALFIFFFALAKKSHKMIGFFCAFVLGWLLGFYQMAKGVHFISDTFIAMLVCFILAALIEKIYKKFVGAG